MDELIAFPNTKFKFGLDPVIGLVPGIGDTASAIVSALVLIQAARHGVPKILLARMSLNILITRSLGSFRVWATRFPFGSNRISAIISYFSPTPPRQNAPVHQIGSSSLSCSQRFLSSWQQEFSLVSSSCAALRNCWGCIDRQPPKCLPQIA